MIEQTAAKLTPYDETESLFRFERTTGDQDSQLNSYKTIADNLSVLREHEADLQDTTYAQSEVKENYSYKIPNIQEARYSFSLLQEWEGYVVSISTETFTARLKDITRGSTIEEEEADFPLSDLEDADQLRLSLGTIFRWVIGYRRSPGGAKDRFSRILFRNLPAWTTKEIEKNQAHAAKWASKLNVE